MRNLKNRKGNSIVGYIIIYPALILFLVYMVVGGAYFMDQNAMLTLSNLSLDRALVEGTFTNEIYNDLEEKLARKGFSDNLEITIAQSEARPENESQYVKRGDIITLQVINREPHPFYYINKIFASSVSEEQFYITTTIHGMSEKW